ncbi:unnamed protein product [Nesidiocoris tenuis]|uniref:Uncharacterized protein n=1 Tax=Nesidiocoris tenuis TaxID=355587 RepID=A0A6H5G605_9HEMI|nr:unnamed protein product [Nesidiocoris tenuis]
MSFDNPDGEVVRPRIDAEKARTEEERMMMNDAKSWLAIGYIHPDKTHPKTGATPLHVAAAKGYLKVMEPPPQTQEIISDDSDKIKKELKTEQPNARPKVPEVPQVELEIQPEPAQNQSTVGDEIVQFKILPNFKFIRGPPQTFWTSLLPFLIALLVQDLSTLPRRRPPLLRSPSEKVLRKSVSGARKVLKLTKMRNCACYPSRFYQRYLELRAKIAGNSLSSLPATPMRSASLKEKHFASSAPVTPTTPTTPGGSKLSPANIFKNFFKSFVPPVRDEESETQRKAHAKRVRETRRSTQGVTLEEIKSAEQLVKKKQQQQLQQATQQLSNSEIDNIFKDYTIYYVPPPPPPGGFLAFRRRWENSDTPNSILGHSSKREGSGRLHFRLGPPVIHRALFVSDDRTPCRIADRPLALRVCTRPRQDWAV